MIRKTIKGGDFKSQMVGELVFDQVPEEGSFNPVTSDAVVKAIDEAKEDMQEKIDEVTLDPSAVALGNVHLLDEVTEFPADGCILVDSETNGPGEMSKDTLLTLTAQNALAGNVAQVFDPTRTSENPYKAGESIAYEGKTYTFKVDHYGAWSAADVDEKPLAYQGMGFVGKGSTFASVVIPNVAPGERYRLVLKTNSWKIDDTGSGQNFIFAILSSDGSTTTNIFYVVRGNAPQTSYEFVIPSSCKSLIVGGRANAGEVVFFDLVNISDTITETQCVCGLSRFGDTNDAKFWQEPVGSAGGVKLKFGIGTTESTNVVFVRLYGTTYTFTAANLVTAGAVLADGVLTLAMAGNKCLCFDILTQSLSVKNLTQVTVNDYKLCWSTSNGAYGPLVDYATTFYGKSLLNNKGLQMYPGGDNPRVYIEENPGSGNSVYVRFYDVVYVRVLSTRTVNMSTLATETGVSLVTSPKGVANCLPVANTQVLCYDYFDDKFVVVSRGDAENYIQLIAVVGGQVVALNTDVLGGCFLMPKLRELATSASEDEFVSLTEYIEKAGTVASDIDGSESADIFLFFTDPHSFQKTSLGVDYADKFKLQMQALKPWSKNLPLDFVLCGGDIVQSSQAKEDVVVCLGLFNGYCRSNLGKPFYGVVGNHEFNTYGTGRLTSDEIATSYLAGISKSSVYKVNTRNGEMLVMDNGDDADDGQTLSDAQKANLAEFAGMLSAVESEHVYVAVHKLSTLTPQSVTDNGIIYYEDMSLCAKAMMDMLVAYNSKTSVQVAGVTYDFTGTTGTCEFIISGHCHKDAQGSYNGIPIILTVNMTPTTNACNFDVVVADFDALQVKITRIGDGSDRTFNMKSHS